MNVTPILRQHATPILFVSGVTWLAAAVVCGAGPAVGIAALAAPFAWFAARAQARGRARIRASQPNVASTANAAEPSPGETVAADSARARAAFLTEMNHELRTPMNGVLGMAELLAETQLTPEQCEYLDAVQRSGENLLDVITDTLDLCRIEAGELAIEPVPFDLLTLVEEAARSTAADADRRGLELVAHCAPDAPRHLVGDCGRIRQVLVNLCSNALKFTSQGTVVIEATCITTTGGIAHIEFSVTDTGTGIPAEHLAHVFDRRSHGEASMTLRLGGTGRGLTVSRALARLMKGDIRVESELGKGTRFVLELPLAVDDSAPSSDRPRVDLGGARTLVVDDLEINRLSMREHLLAIGARCETAGSEDEALSILRTARVAGDPIAIAFIDVEMPDTTGTVLCHMIKGELESSSPRFVLMAPETHRARRRTWQLAGFEACLQKPLRRTDIEDCMTELRSESTEGSRTNSGSNAAAGDLRAHANAALARGPKELLGLNVLIVEDNLVNQRVAERMLEKLGCNVAIADNGREALDRCEHARFDLVLMDCQMPVLDGFSATEELRKRERSRGTARIPILALTANAMQGDREQCLAAGMDDHLAKPIVRDDLIAALMRWRPRLVDPYPPLPSQRIRPPNPGVSPVPARIKR